MNPPRRRLPSRERLGFEGPTPLTMRTSRTTEDRRGAPRPAGGLDKLYPVSVLKAEVERRTKARQSLLRRGKAF